MKTEFKTSAKDWTWNFSIIAIIVTCIIMYFVGLEISELIFMGCLFLLIPLFHIIGTRKDNKQVEITEQGLKFFYENDVENHRFDEYDGFMLVIVASGSKWTEYSDVYMYLVKDHKRKDVINLSKYKNNVEFLAEVETYMKKLGEKKISLATHCFGGGNLEY